MMKHAIRIIQASVIGAVMCGCAFATALPEDKAAYQGDWRGKDMRLKIEKNGKIQYQRKTAEKDVNLSIEFSGFNNDGFSAGFGIVQTRFVVTKPPYQADGKTKMVVDGVELTKTE